MLRALALFLILASAVSPVLAQDRAPDDRQRLLDLAYTLGESHALRQACQGPDDQFWRSRMVRLTDVEQADQAFDARLRDRFNVGFAAGQAEFPTCDATSRKAEQLAARKGQGLALTLSRSMRPTAPPGPPPESLDPQ